MTMRLSRDGRMIRILPALLLMGLVAACREAAAPSAAGGDGPEAVSRDWGDERDPAASTADPDRDELIPRRAFARIAKEVAPAVVHLRTVREVQRDGAPFAWRPQGGLLDGLLNRFRNPPDESAMKQQGVGSGFFVHRTGYVLTNDHVVKRTQQIMAVLSDGQEFPAHVIGRDPDADLALLRIEGAGPFPAARLGDSENLESGEWAMAVGSPFGLAQTFTVGVISATGRSHLGIASRENFIQTDASINYGNSGGPLLNIRAQVVGINTAILPSGNGIGFAIPIGMARQFMATVLKNHPIPTAWLGIQVRHPLSEPSDPIGMVVQSVQWGSPASRSGVRAGDRLIRVDDAPVAALGRLQRMIADGGIGVERTLTIERRGTIREIRVRSEERPARVFP